MLLVMPCVGILTTCACSVHVLTVKTGTEPQVELQIAVKWRLGRNVFEKQTPPRSHMPAEMLQEFQKLWKNFCTDDLLSANDLFFFFSFFCCVGCFLCAPHQTFATLRLFQDGDILML